MYAGAELVRLLSQHQDVTLTHLYVSEKSADAHVHIDELYGNLRALCSLPLEPLSLQDATGLTNEDCDVIFLATEHQVSHDLAPILLDNGIVVIDLSGAFRISDLELFSKYYGFAFGPKQTALMADRIYGLVDWVKKEDLQSHNLISMPGCYPTCSELALLPLAKANLLSDTMPPVINAVSGVSGAGRKAKLTNSFCEVSLNAYGLFKHRHLIEIEEQVGRKVIFNPHLGDFKRGILATITVQLKDGVTDEQIAAAYHEAYPTAHVPAHEPKHGAPAKVRAGEALDCLVRVQSGTVKLHDVQNTPFCNISYTRDGNYMVISSAIDNLLKGAASQAIEAFNIHYGLPRARSLL